MEKGVIVMSIVVGFFGGGSAVLGFIAEGTKLTPDDIYVSSTRGGCVHPGNPAFALGLIAVLLLAVAQITVSVVGGCCGCCGPRGGSAGSKRIIGVVLSVLSWIAAVIAGLFFAEGAVWNTPVKHDTALACYYVKDGVFRTAAILTLVSTVLGILSYILLRAAAATAATAASATPGPVAGPASGSVGEPKPDGLAMGQHAPVYGQAPYAHFPPPPYQGYAQFPPAAPAQRHAQAV